MRLTDAISRQAAIAEFSCCELTPDGGIDANYAIDFLERLPSVQPEYTENEKKVLVMMFTIVKNILDLQDGYMDIDCTIFGHNELFDLSQKIGIDY